MPKLKTSKTTKKRFKVTGTGKVMIMRLPGRKHLMSTKNASRKRRLRRQPTLNKIEAKTILTLLRS
jgi:large subunit ribosomal protein L35